MYYCNGIATISRVRHPTLLLIGNLFSKTAIPTYIQFKTIGWNKILVLLLRSLYYFWLLWVFEENCYLGGNQVWISVQIIWKWWLCFLSYIDLFNKNVYESDDAFLKEGNHHHRALSFPALSEASKVSELKTTTTAF